MKKLVVLFLFFSSSLFAGSLDLINDTDLKLRVIIQGNDDIVIASFTIGARKTISWKEKKDTNPYGATGSLPPYKVTWYCPDGTIYSVCQSVPSGDEVSPSRCVGPQACED